MKIKASESREGPARQLVTVFLWISLFATENALSGVPCPAPALQPPLATFTVAQVEARIDCLEQVLRDVASELKSVSQDQVLDDLITDQPLIFPGSAAPDVVRPETVEEATAYLELLLRQERNRLSDVTGDVPATQSTPAELEDSLQGPESYLIVEQATLSTATASGSGVEASQELQAPVTVQAEGESGEAGASPVAASQEKKETTINTLLADDVTSELHDDTTILRDVRVGSKDSSGVLIFDALRLWVGGAVQYDYYNFDGIYHSTGEGDQRDGAEMRRLEATVRSRLYDWGEIKAQYDFDQGIFRDLYLRWVSEVPGTPTTVTVGNQKEPIGLDNLLGNKFGIAQERSAPSHAFGTWRSLGVRLHRAFELKPEQRKFDYWSEDSAFLTTSVGVFTSDLEDSHETDLALTGRVTAGRQKDGIGMHVGVAASFREGEYNRISMRPEVREADRIVLAQPDANKLGIGSLEGAYNNGRFHAQAEIFAARYGGRVDGYGMGGYLQAGWYLTEDSRSYNSRWGIFSPHSTRNRVSVEVFARLSHTRGDDDIQGWNDFKAVSLGSNVHYRKFRGSINLFYGESRVPVVTEEEGKALVIRAQYLF